MPSILPNNPNVSTTPEEILRYLNADGLRQLMRQERLRWNLKVNRDSDKFSETTNHRYSGDVHNEGDHQRMDTRRFPDNDADPGYAGVYTDAGEFGLVHDHGEWNGIHTFQSDTKSPNPRVEIGSNMTVSPNGPNKRNMHVTYNYDSAMDMVIPSQVLDVRKGYGMNPDTKEMEADSPHRTAAHIYDSHDGRIYALTNDEAVYVNNANRNSWDRLPTRTAARIIDIPTNTDQLLNRSSFVSDPNHIPTDGNFTFSNQFIVDNLDDRTFVTPELSKDTDGVYLTNVRQSLYANNPGYGASDGEGTTGEDHIQIGKTLPTSIDRGKAAFASDNGYNTSGYFPGIFASYEELLQVDLLGQKRTTLTHLTTPNSRRRQNYYQLDGVWEPQRNVNDTTVPPSIFGHDNLGYVNFTNEQSSPANQESDTTKHLHSFNTYTVNANRRISSADLYQWRYNRVELTWYHSNISAEVVASSGTGYQVNDILQCNVLGVPIYLRVYQVDANGTPLDVRVIFNGEGDNPLNTNNTTQCQPDRPMSFNRDPFFHKSVYQTMNCTGHGRRCNLKLSCKPTTRGVATQLKNNLYAYVDVVPTVPFTAPRTTHGLDVMKASNVKNVEDLPDMMLQSSAASPAYSGLNSGRGSLAGEVKITASDGIDDTSAGADNTLVEHSGNPTAGAHVHLFRYVIDTTGNSFVEENGVRIYTGTWVDQGPMGVERPCDIKALLLSNPDTNNFNNYYKFMLDIMMDTYVRVPDKTAIVDGTVGTAQNVCNLLLHVDDKDPWQRMSTDPVTTSGPSQTVYTTLKTTYGVKLLRAATGDVLDHQAFFEKRLRADQEYGYAGPVYYQEVTDRVLYFNAATGVAFIYNAYNKNDTTDYMMSAPIGWQPVSPLFFDTVNHPQRPWTIDD